MYLLSIPDTANRAELGVFPRVRHLPLANLCQTIRLSCPTSLLLWIFCSTGPAHQITSILETPVAKLCIHPKRTLVFAALLTAGLAAQAAPLKIGLVETLSGPQASTGLMFKAATRYAIDQINADGGWNGEQVQLVEYDNQGGAG